MKYLFFLLYMHFCTVENVYKQIFLLKEKQGTLKALCQLRDLLCRVLILESMIPFCLFVQLRHTCELFSHVVCDKNCYVKNGYCLSLLYQIYKEQARCRYHNAFQADIISPLFIYSNFFKGFLYFSCCQSGIAGKVTLSHCNEMDLWVRS